MSVRVLSTFLQVHMYWLESFEVFALQTSAIKVPLPRAVDVMHFMSKLII